MINDGEPHLWHETNLNYAWSESENFRFETVQQAELSSAATIIDNHLRFLRFSFVLMWLWRWAFERPEKACYSRWSARNYPLNSFLQQAPVFASFEFTSPSSCLGLDSNLTYPMSLSLDLYCHRHNDDWNVWSLFCITWWIGIFFFSSIAAKLLRSEFF